MALDWSVVDIVDVMIIVVYCMWLAVVVVGGANAMIGGSLSHCFELIDADFSQLQLACILSITYPTVLERSVTYL